MPLKDKTFSSIVMSFVLLITLLSHTVASETAGADSVMAEIDSVAWVAEGQGKRVVYLFFDPNCPSCQFLFKNLRSFVQSGEYQFRWVPVAIVNPTSLGKAAAILEADNPLEAFYKNETHYQAYSGGLDEQIASQTTERKLAVNERLLNKLNIPVIPSMLFIDKDQKTVLIQGALSPLALRKVFARLP